MIVISGVSGFVGMNLINRLDGAVGLSLRENGWERKLLSADAIVNLVGKAHDHKGVAIEQDYYEANVVLTKKVFNAFLNSRATILIHLSSIAAVEEFESLYPLTESSECNPQSWYGKTKFEAEKWLMSQNLPETKRLIIIRPPMIHGPGDKGNLGLLYKIISKGIPYPLSSFENNRSFVSVENLVFFIQQILEKQELLTSGIYHISDNESISTKELISIIKKITKKNVPNLAVPKFLICALARVGDFIPLPLNSKRLKKMTSTLLVSNDKIKQVLNISSLPLTAQEGLELTLKSLAQMENPL